MIQLACLNCNIQKAWLNRAHGIAPVGGNETSFARMVIPRSFSLSWTATLEASALDNFFHVDRLEHLLGSIVQHGVDAAGERGREAGFF